ncbi:hypothetical protein TIFTF001_018692 [Ficus carica]|uniref:Protein kinase domain-containing protein n=1 Tax=Ficus carica TaxID=3494 RepID=A0AA88A7I6_FICCA|nr:hypothetical protein TIFTF001_018692 [Ficus carica]
MTTAGWVVKVSLQWVVAVRVSVLGPLCFSRFHLSGTSTDVAVVAGGVIGGLVVAARWSMMVLVESFSTRFNSMSFQRWLMYGNGEVTLYVMLVGAYPFEDQEYPKNFRKTINSAQYKIPENVHISQDCRHLISCIFVANPVKRVTIKDIKSHPWFLKNLPRELTGAAQAMYYRQENPSFFLQSIDDIMKIV